MLYLCILASALQSSEKSRTCLVPIITIRLIKWGGVCGIKPKRSDLPSDLHNMPSQLLQMTKWNLSHIHTAFVIKLDDPMHIFACFNLKNAASWHSKHCRSWSPAAITVPVLHLHQYTVNDMYHCIHVHLIRKVEEVQTDSKWQEKLDGWSKRQHESEINQQWKWRGAMLGLGRAVLSMCNWTLMAISKLRQRAFALTRRTWSREGRIN